MSRSAKGIIRLSEPRLLRDTCELLVEERVASGLLGSESLTRRIDELTRGGMMSRDTQVTGVAKGVLALTACK